MKHYLLGAAAVALVSTSLSAQTAPAADPAAAASVAPVAVVPPPPPPPPADLVLNAGAPITLAVAEDVSSSSHRAGDIFKLTVLNDVSVGQTVVIPRGTPASAEITWRTGKGAFGKSGKIEFALMHIDLNGQKIPVTGTYRQEGEGNTIGTGVGVIAVGVFAGFITGKRAKLPIGRELMAQLAQPVTFSASGQLSPSFDSAAAVAAADAKTPWGACRNQANAITNEKKRKDALEDCFTERME